MTRNQARIHGLLRKSLTGEFFDVQFYLFSARSKREGNVSKLRALFSNREALASHLEYFTTLVPEQTLNHLDLVGLKDYHAPKGDLSLDEYGYASDSDLDDEDEEIDQTVHDRAQRIITSHTVLITDTAFNTWAALLYYLYTDEIVFTPLRSQANSTARRHGFHEPPSCSPKSMYRLACKIKHDQLQAKAFAAIQSGLTEHNILRELSSSLTSRFPPILAMETQCLRQLLPTSTPTTMVDADPQ